MKRIRLRVCLSVLVSMVLMVWSISPAFAEKPIIIGAPLSMAYLYGWDAQRGMQLAVDEINAAGGVNVNGKKRVFQVEVIDTRDLEPGVPVSEALMALERLILNKKCRFYSGRTQPVGSSPCGHVFIVQI